MDQKINLIIERGRVWDIAELPEKSIAVDGAVIGPFIDNRRKVYSFDHHGNCVRHASTATCVQVMDALLLGLDPEGFNVYINDIDHDTVLAAILLMEPKLAFKEKVQEIVRVIGLIDAHGPSYPFQPGARQLINTFNAIVMAPYNKVKNEKKYGETDLRELLDTCMKNFPGMLNEELAVPEEAEEEVSYELTPETGGKWVMAKSSGFIFGKLYNDGFNAAVTWDRLPDGSYSYTIGKKSEFIDFPVKEIIGYLASVEPGWGGGSTIGGAPRKQDGSRSKIPPEKLVQLIKDFLSGK